MKKDKNTSADAAELRRRAEARLKALATKGAPARTEADTQRLVHELQVHQIELEMQNEELRQSRAEVETGLERYTELYDFAPVGYLTLGREGAIRNVNLAGARLLGMERARLPGRRFGLLVAEPDRTGFNAFLEKVFASQAKEECEVALLKKGKGPLNVHITATVSQDGQECRAMMVDITERTQVEHAQLFLQQCGWSTSGEDFFRALARYLAETLDMDYVCIDRLEGDGLTAKTVAVYRDGSFVDNLAYALKDTPGGDVVGKAVCTFPKDVRHLFPRDKVLQEMMAESYIGTTLWGSRGKPIGLISVIGRQPRADLHLAAAILKVVTIRTAGELERSRTAAEMKRLASFPILNPNPIVEADVAGHVHFCNPTAERMFPDLYQRGLGHPWFADWESMMSTLREGGSKSIVREVSVDQSWFQQTVHFVEDGQRVRIYGIDITARMRSEAAIEISEARYRRLFETSQDGILILDAETGQISDVNPFLVEMLGYSHEEFLGKKLWEIGAFINTEATKAAFLELKSKGYVRYEDLPLETKEGRPIAVEFICKVYLVNHLKVIQCNIRDITERKVIAEALQQAHNELEQRVEERTVELRTALSEIKTMKDQLEAENIYFRQEINTKHQFGQIIGQSDGLKYVLYRAEQVAPANTTVLILGETGTGKELIAAAVHDMSPRKNRSLITVNCAALPDNLIESELFGREKGAFTGADTRQVGRFEIANGSTLCLDEIGELPLKLQAKLLRVIQHNEFERLGSSHTIKVDVRIVATTNRDLEEEVRKGRFRQDLYYRLNVFPITVPPLRQRKDDIPLLVKAFIARYARKLGKQITSVQKKTMKTLQDYPWPGNVRELESVLERAVILCPGPVLQLADKLDISSSPISSAIRTLEEVERNQILKILSETRWRIEGKDGAAEILGLHPSTLRARMHKLEIVRPESKEPE